jgi:hypothetical protein
MLKLVSPRPPASPRETRKRGSVQDEIRNLHRQIDENHAIGQSTQRAVARGRRAVVEAERGEQRASRSAVPDGTPAPATEHVRLLAELARRIKETHERLLVLSTGVEAEMDRLDLIRAEVEQLSTDAQARRTQ